jgi:enoyl-CoA hydratase
MSAINEENTVLVRREGPICTVTLNRPDRLNALNPDLLQGLTIELAKLGNDPDVRVVVITGSGDKSFVAGADIHSMNQLGPRAIADYLELGQRTMRLIESLKVPVVAAINGFAFGGGLELALACDILVCKEGAVLGQPEVDLGIIPGFGGTQRLIQRCGVGTARKLCMTGERLTAADARLLGVVDVVVPDAEFKAEVEKLSKTLASKAPLAVQGVKRVVNRAVEQIVLSGLRHEVEEFLRIFASADREEGMSAFLEKRAAKFTGR